MPAPNELGIKTYMHCGLCIDEYKQIENPQESPADYARLSVGWTKEGLQVWCHRHDCNVLHVNFDGNKLPADTTRVATEQEMQTKGTHGQTNADANVITLTIRTDNEADKDLILETLGELEEDNDMQPFSVQVT